ncbi:hypothetical protein L226DRAFT_575571 [Lentinus tigrinus ALCF2SS1-7]|uniref:uncharacterized protein n=1 Tax=Lentinus tigrinus ALCF2SS1-7 TaxID=1328758 RepID=UPI001165EFB7|nr:hypothetical protein L226DRAFT_575571 [Lentinus tigrinus ALCF2SS1-7]
MDDSAGPQSYSASLHSAAAGRIASVPPHELSSLLSSSAPGDGQSVSIPYAVLLEWQERLRVVNDALQTLINAYPQQPFGELLQQHTGHSMVPLFTANSVGQTRTTPPQPAYYDWGRTSDLIGPEMDLGGISSANPRAIPGTSIDPRSIVNMPSFSAVGEPGDSTLNTRRKKRAKVATGYVLRGSGRLDLPDDDDDDDDG